MIGMAIGLAILTAYGSTTIDRLYDQLYATPESYLAIIPEDLRDRPLRDPFVVEALEDWASREAAGIMVGLFVVAAGVTIAAIPPGLALGSRRRRLETDEAAAAPPSGEAAAGSPPGEHTRGDRTWRANRRPLSVRRNHPRTGPLRWGAATASR